MAGKYHISLKPTEPRFIPVSKYSSIEKEGCLGCLKCVKRISCIYDVYKKRQFNHLQIAETGDNMCLSCMRCVQECKKGILSRAVNPNYEKLGNDYWTPELIHRIWNQAQNGKIPVSGAGYRGPFTGPGFDSMWTDMSEIVRPTRDGIHGREFISTVVELGRRPSYLEFDQSGDLASKLTSLIQIPIPFILDIPRFGIIRHIGRSTCHSIFKAAKDLGTLAFTDFDEQDETLADYTNHLIPRYEPGHHDPALFRKTPVVEIPYSKGWFSVSEALKRHNPCTIISIRIPLDEYALERSGELIKNGAEILHFQADSKGQGTGKNSGRFITTLMREVHEGLVEKGIRELCSIIISGGIAMAEHAAKIIICGADAVGVDLALLIAMECRLCSLCTPQDACPVNLQSVTVEWGAQRIVNLLGSWHSQLIEVLGAMGLREVRRLRGETGRAMFFDELERECFAPIFSRRQKGQKIGTGLSETMNEPANAQSPAPSSRPFFPQNLIAYTQSRYRNPLTKYKVVRTSACNGCGRCMEVCIYGVHRKGGKRMLPLLSEKCHGPDDCKANNRFCVDHCPQGALRVGLNPLWRTFGDSRWPADLIVSTWIQATNGRLPDQPLEYRKGDSRGGFDKIDIIFPDSPLSSPHLRVEDIDLSIPLNRREDERPKITIGFPVYGGGMSFGAISLATIISRARAYRAFNSFTCTGEGGYPEEIKEFKDNVITQVATGLFGVREETIQRARIVEFKYAQGAKPGLGGHLLGDKVTPSVAKMREAVVGSSLFSPFPFHSVYSVEDHKKHVDWIKIINPDALVSVKVSTPVDVDMVAVGSYYAGAHIIHLDGSYGGTGAAPDIAKKNIAMPIEYAIPKVHKFLLEEGIRNRMTLIASGGLRTVWDAAKAIALGADGVVICTAELVALECIRCGNCESGRGCPRGIATTDPDLSAAYDSDWATQRLVNLFSSWYIQLREILRRLGMKRIRELVGRSDLLVHKDYL